MFESAHFEYRKADHIAVGIHLFHDLIIVGLTEITFLPLENHFEVIAFRVVPDF